MGKPLKEPDADGDIYFLVYATIDMCKIGPSQVLGLPWRNTDPSVSWVHSHCKYDPDNDTREDCYGDRPRPVPVGDVLFALRQDMAGDADYAGYRRHRWACSLLAAMANDSEDLQVLVYGH